MAEKVMALLFEDTGIKLLVATGRKVGQWANTPLEPGLVVGGVIVDEAKVADKVREIFNTIQHSKVSDFVSGKGKVTVGLSGRDSLYRILSFPVLEKSMLAEAVRREAGRVLPVPLDQLYLAYQRIPGNDKEMRIFLAAFPKSTADALLRTLRLAGEVPRVLDLAPLALCLAVNEPRSIIVDAMIDNLNIMIMADRVPQVIRSLSLHGEGKTISENMPTIIEEFSRTVAFYNSGHPQALLDADVPVFVSGDLATAPDMWLALVGNLNYKVSVLPQVMQYPDNFPVNDFVVNLGLATKALSLEKEHGNYSLVNLNALPESALPQPLNPYRIIIPIVTVAGIAGVLLMWNAYQSAKKNTATVQSQLTAKQTLITGNTKDIAAITEQNRLVKAQIQPIIDSANIFTIKLQDITAARSLTDSELNRIIELKPPTVDVSAVTCNANAMTVAGSAATQIDVLAYAQALRDKGGFKVIVSTISYTAIVKDTGEKIASYSFSFLMN